MVQGCASLSILSSMLLPELTASSFGAVFGRAALREMAVPGGKPSD
jgi:hypothetical protein